MKIRSIAARLVSVAVSAVIVLTSMMIPVSAADSGIETAKEAVAEIGAGWNLGNSLDSCGSWIAQWSDGKPERYETAWGNPVTTKKLITAVKTAGFNAVRVPVTWAEHIDDSGSINSEWLGRVQEVVDYVISQDMYCIINVHHDAGADGWLEASSDCYKSSSDKFAGLWRNIAERFKNYGAKLIFESFNEMLDKNNSWSDARSDDAYKAVNDFNALFVKTVRATGGKKRTAQSYASGVLGKLHGKDACCF